MVNLRELERKQKNIKSFDEEFFKVLHLLVRILELKKYNKQKGFNEYMSRMLSETIIRIVRLAKYFNINLEKQFEEWYVKKTKKFSVKEGYNEVAEEYDKLFNIAILVEQPKFLKLIGNVKGKRVLDVGCGTGRYSILLAKKGAKVEGVDISERMLEIAKKKSKKVNFRKANATKLPYKDNQFDLVISALAIDHIKNYKKAISELVRVCKPNGKIIFSMMHPEIFTTDYAIFNKKGERVLIERHQKTIGDLVSELNKNGAKIEKVEELSVPKNRLNGLPLDLYFYTRKKKFILIIKARKIRNF